MRVLLHTCCAVCASHCVKVLMRDGHVPVLYYSNQNIAPEAEWLRRLESVKLLAEREGLEYRVDAYDHAGWLADVARGFEGCREGGERCGRCFGYSLRRTFAEMGAVDCVAFTTSLTVSPHKRSPLILEIGLEVGGGAFLPYNFKKQNGFLESIQLARAYGLYQQDYCGCGFSLAERRISLGVN